MKLVQREFLDLYRHYHSQLPGLSGDHIREMQYVVRDMADKYEQKNPYLVSLDFVSDRIRCSLKISDEFEITLLKHVNVSACWLRVSVLYY